MFNTITFDTKFEHSVQISRSKALSLLGNIEFEITKGKNPPYQTIDVFLPY